MSRELLKAEELASLILDSILAAKTFNMADLMPVVSAHVRHGLRLRDAPNYEKKESNAKAKQRMRAIEKQAMEKDFWKNVAKSLQSDEEMERHYKQLKAKL